MHVETCGGTCGAHSCACPQEVAALPACQQHSIPTIPTPSALFVAL